MRFVIPRDILHWVVTSLTVIILPWDQGVIFALRRDAMKDPLAAR